MKKFIAIAAALATPVIAMRIISMAIARQAKTSLVAG